MLLGALYADCEDYNAEYGWNYNCDCNEDTWQEYYPDMEGCWLEGANLDGANLEEANLYQAFLQDANLSWANLTRANLTGAFLESVVLTYTDLSNTDLSNADLTDTWCLGAFFVGANLEGTIFEDADLTYAYFDENLDYYDDVSYDAGAESGDLNLDGVDNIQDVIILVNNIINP